MKVLVTSYTFDKTARTVTFTGYGSIFLDHILLITNTTSNIIVYSFASPTKGGTVATNVLTLTYDTSAMSNTDKLQIFYWDTAATQPIDDGSGSITIDGTVAIGAGSAVIGHVIADSGSTTAVTGNVTVVQGTATNLKVDASAVAVPITDNAGSLTVDYATTGSGNATGALRVELPTNGTGVIATLGTITNAVHVDDNSGSLTVDGAVTTSSTDSVPSTQNITAQDVASSSTAMANSQSFVTGTATTNSTASFTVTSKETAKIQVTGTWTGTLVVEQSLDGGTTWVTTGVHQTGSSYTAGTFTNNFIGGLNISGATNIRVRATAAWTGTATVKLITSDNPNSVYVANGLSIQDSTTSTQKWGILSSGAGKTDITSIAGTAPTTVGKIDVKGADGDVFVRQATASNLNMTEASAASILTKLTAGAASMVKLEDVASSDADAGCPAMAVRKATPANTSGTDGDYEMLQMNAGRLWVDPSGVTLTANATLAAETTKVIGVTRTSDGAGNLITSNSTTYTAKFGLDNNLLGTLGTAFTTAGKVDVKAADGDVFVRQATASNLNATVVGTGTFAVQATLANETTKVIGTVNNAEGTTNIGYTFSRLVTLSTDVTRQAADTTTYANNDALSNSTTAPTAGGFTFTSAGRASGGSGIISDIIVTSMANPAILLAGELWIFSQAVTNINDNAAFGVTDGEIKTLVAIVPFTLSDAGNNSYYHAQNLSIGYTCVGTANLRFLVRVKNAYIPVGSEVITFILKAVQVD